MQNNLVYDLGTTPIFRWPSGVARVMKLCGTEQVPNA